MTTDVPLSEQRRCELLGQLVAQSRVALANSELGLAAIESYRAGTISAADALDVAFGVLLHARNNQRIALEALGGVGPDLSPDDVLRLVS